MCDAHHEKYGPRQTEDELRAMVGRSTNWNDPRETLRALSHTAQLSREIQVVEEFGGDVDALAAEVVRLRGERDNWKKSYDLTVQALELALSEARSLASDPVDKPTP